MLRLVVSAFTLSIATATAALAQGAIPPNTIDCAAFAKRPDGNWYVSAPTTFDIGDTKRTTLGPTLIRPKSFMMGGANLYNVLEDKCGKK